MSFRFLVAILCRWSLAGQRMPTENPQTQPPGSVPATTRLLNAKAVFLKESAGAYTACDTVSRLIYYSSPG